VGFEPTQEAPQAHMLPGFAIDAEAAKSTSRRPWIKITKMQLF